MTNLPKRPPDRTYRTETEAVADNFMRAAGDYIIASVADSGRTGVWILKPKEKPMTTGTDLKTIRAHLNLTQAQMGYVLGYTGKPHVVAQTISKFERGIRETPVPIRRLTFMYYKHGLPKEVDPHVKK